MLVRALIVLLIALNLGAAAWWIARPAPPAPAAEALPPGVARLQLVDESRRIGERAPAPAAALPSAATAQAAPPIAAAKPLPNATANAASKPAAPLAAPAPAAAPAAAPPVPALAAAPKPQCFSIGPFADADAADAARAKLQPLAQKLVARTQSSSTSRGWRVYLPPAASATEAQATAQRIRAAGFDDLFVMSGGSDANGIALGRFRNEESARRRGAALAAAGFAARVESLDGGAGGATWFDVSTTSASGDALRRAAGAARWRSRACEGLG